MEEHEQINLDLTRAPLTCLCEIPNVVYTLERFLIMTTNILTDEPFESPNLLIFTSFPARQKFRIFKQFSYSVADFRLSPFLTCSFFRLVFFLHRFVFKDLHVDFNRWNISQNIWVWIFFKRSNLNFRRNSSLVLAQFWMNFAFIVFFFSNILIWKHFFCLYCICDYLPIS